MIKSTKLKGNMLLVLTVLNSCEQSSVFKIKFLF